MSQRAPRTIFIAGTDTDVGKTYTAALIARSLVDSGMNVGVYKPVASGCREEDEKLVADDAVRLWEAAGRPNDLAEVCPQKFVAALAPTQAALLENKTVDREQLRKAADVCSKGRDIFLVEGAGGLMSPLAVGFLNIDLAKQFDDVELVIVAANRLGAIHQTLATCAAATATGLTPAGIILCCPVAQQDTSVKSNRQEIASYTDVPVLGEIDFGCEMIPAEIARRL